MMAGRFEEQVAVVTGGAGGIGLAVARLLAAEGAHVAAWDLRAPEAGPEIHWFGCDVQDRTAVIRAAQDVRQRLGAPGIVVHCAAVNAFHDTLSVTETEFNTVMRVNVLSAFWLAQAFVPQMKERKRGSIVLVSSITGIVGAPGLSAYSASKGALITLTRTLALELAESGIRVNCVCPASVDTPMLRASFARHADPQAALEANTRRHPLGRLGTPGDVARFVLFLASDEAAWVTGGTHVVDGGALLARRWKE